MAFGVEFRLLKPVVREFRHAIGHVSAAENTEAQQLFRAAGRDATLMRRLADRRALSAADVEGASDGAIELLRDWCDAGWLHPQQEVGNG